MEILKKYSELFIIICVIVLHFYLLASDKWIGMTNTERFILIFAALFGILALIGQIMKVVETRSPQMNQAMPGDQSFIV